MRIDLSIQVAKELLNSFGLKQALIGDQAGHVGTHLDTMDKEFSIEKCITRGRIFDISTCQNQVIKPEDVDLNSVEPGDFIMFYSGTLKKHGYATKAYFSAFKELSDELIDRLIAKKVSFIGVDMTGAKQGKEHIRIDQYCADQGVLIIENMNNLDLVYETIQNNPFTVYTFPLNMIGFSGLPCRVAADI